MDIPTMRHFFGFRLEGGGNSSLGLMQRETLDPSTKIWGPTQTRIDGSDRIETSVGKAVSKAVFPAKTSAFA